MPSVKSVNVQIKTGEKYCLPSVVPHHWNIFRSAPCDQKTIQLSY